MSVSQSGAHLAPFLRMDTGGSWPSESTAPPQTGTTRRMRRPCGPGPRSRCRSSRPCPWSRRAGGSAPARHCGSSASLSSPQRGVAAALLVAPGPTTHPTGHAVAPSGAPSSSPTAAPPTTEVAAVLARRTAALRSGDRSAFLADIDTYDPAFVAEQTRLFGNLRKLPLSSVSWKQNGDHAYARRGRSASSGRRRTCRLSCSPTGSRASTSHPFRGRWPSPSSTTAMPGASQPTTTCPTCPAPTGPSRGTSRRSRWPARPTPS